MSRESKGSYRNSHRIPGKGIVYDHHFELPHRHFLWTEEQRILDALISQYFARRPFAYLDFACGTGRLLNHIAPKASTAIGVDISEDMLTQAAARMADANLVLSDITESNPFGDMRFDLITAFRFFPNAEDSLRLSVARSLRSLLKDDGILVFNNHKNRYSIMGMAMRLYSRIRGAHFRTMTLHEIEHLALSANLEVLEIRYTGVVPGYEWLLFLPISAYRHLERFFGKISWLRHLASDQIVVCKPKSQ